MRTLITGATGAPRPDQVPEGVLELHRAIAGYRSTPLVSLPALADAWGAGQLVAKLETDRWGLPSFKVVGTTWAVVEALRNLLPADWTPAAGLAGLRGRLPRVTLIAASEGNHGEALAFVARLLGLPCRIYVSGEVADGVVARIRAQQADIAHVAGTYDDAVAASSAAASAEAILVSDTSWPGYERIPRAVAHGYSTILREVQTQLAETTRPDPDLVIVPVGVGALASAVVDHFAARSAPRPQIVGVEPCAAACVTASLAADRPISVPGPLASSLSGLNCGTPSLIAWPALRGGLAGTVTLDDTEAGHGAKIAEREGLRVGPCSGGVLAAAHLLLGGPDGAAHRTLLGLGERPSVLLILSDGRPDPDHRKEPGRD
ncbi:pyridoxal-phosphate dependent enzyme [Microlunatus sp. GCM10028923]|uniref:pyridoxal-phosphate dependent enzyme n=1 Tax=Microlunatus sp. GCM10028923 TaxID=3273400 RepID=UPI0036136042